MAPMDLSPAGEGIPAGDACIARNDTAVKRETANQPSSGGHDTAEQEKNKENGATRCTAARSTSSALPACDVIRSSAALKNGGYSLRGRPFHSHDNNDDKVRATSCRATNIMAERLTNAVVAERWRNRARATALPPPPQCVCVVIP